MEIKELQKEIYSLEKKLKSINSFNHRENQVELKKIAKEIIDLLEEKFSIKIETYCSDGNITNKFNFLKKENKNPKEYEGQGFFWGEAYGVEVNNISKEFFMSNLKDLFYLFFHDYQFEDAKKIITITHDGDLTIKVK
jgi:hypothetical protein